MAWRITLNMKEQIDKNRQKYLYSLRNDKWHKGTILSDVNGRPIINTKSDDNGFCACAIMIELFQKDGKPNFKFARKELGITAVNCTFIQRELNDTKLSFPEIADRIESEIFNK